MAKILSSSVKKAISIPKRIKRSPTDLLKALSLTVDADPNAPHYKYYDDTFTLPTNSSERRNFSLAKSSGIKAARLMISKYPLAFYKDDCEPHVPAFFPKKTFTKQELKFPDESVIYSLIDWGQFLEAFNAYLKCKDEKIAISEECKRALFEALCLHNGSNLDEKRPLDEDFYNRPVVTQQYEINLRGPTSTWKANSEAEKMFEELKDKTASAYCSLIKGMINHIELTKANEFYLKMKELKLVPDVETYNSLIKMAIHNPRLQTDNDRYNSIIDYLNEMKREGVTPNLRTFNSSLYGLTKIPRFPKSLSTALSIIKEMKILNIQPCLTTWSYILLIAYPKGAEGKDTVLLPQIINEVERLNINKEIQVFDENDGDFFFIAMNRCANLDDMGLAKRLHSIVLTGSNRQLFTNNLVETKYYEKYFRILYKIDSPENTLNEWSFLVPNLWSPPFSLMDEIVRFVVQHEFYDYVPKLWSDLLLTNTFAFVEALTSETILDSLLGLMANYKSIDANSILQNQYGEITRAILDKFAIGIAKEGEGKYSTRWTGSMISSTIRVFLNIDDFLTAWHIYELSFDSKNKIVGELSEVCLFELFNYCLNANDIDKAIAVVKVTSSLLYPSCLQCIAKIHEGFSLTQDQKAILIKLNEDYAKVTQRNTLKLI